ncbi:hypothetical protein KBI23_06530 [bacterium]|nr:hypothetical protein [bacterium]MBP9807115.1 hypothetical protein [bacterium]
MIESKNSSIDKVVRVARTTGLCTAALLINLAGIVFIGYVGAMTAGLVNFPLYLLLIAIKSLVATNTLPSALTIIPHSIMFLCVSALPISVAALNLYVLSKAAGKYKALFAQCLAFTSITWALMGISLAVYLTNKGEFTSISIFAVPTSLIVGCLSQFWFASRIAKRARPKTSTDARDYSKINSQLSKQIEAIGNATTSSELGALAAECLTMMEVKQLSEGVTQDSVHVLIDELVRAEMPAQAEIVSSRMMHFLEQE